MTRLRHILWQFTPTRWLVAALFAAILAGQAYAAEPEHAKPEPEPAKVEPANAAAAAAAKPESSGLELGEYRIRSDYPAEAQKSTVKFTLYAAVSGEQSAKMQRLVEEHKEKIRDEVITATRLTPLAVFEEPDLASFRRRILIRLRRTMPEFVIDDLYITDFSLLVKSL